jgi:hypothetical protein
MWNLVSICFETVLTSVQDRCMVCTERTIGIEIILDTLDGTRLKWKLGSVRLQIVLLLMQDWCMVCVERTEAQK